MRRAAGGVARVRGPRLAPPAGLRPARVAAPHSRCFGLWGRREGGPPLNAGSGDGNAGEEEGKGCASPRVADMFRLDLAGWLASA
jgi:hypothetical protein